MAFNIIELCLRIFSSFIIESNFIIKRGTFKLDEKDLIISFLPSKRVESKSTDGIAILFHLEVSLFILFLVEPWGGLL